MGRIPALLLVAAATLALMAEARAEAETCTALEARLASIDRSSEDFWNNDLRNTEAAIDRKRVELDRALTAARHAGCRGVSLFKTREPTGNCEALTGSIERINTALHALEAKRRQFAGDPYAAERERSQVIREMVANGCGARHAAYQDNGRRRTGLFSSLFGGRRLLRGGDGHDNGFGGGTYRTLCVRTCDGYYFPISFDATPASFSRDEGACRSLCPGTDVSLYVHRNPGEEAAQMVSLAGEAYTALPNAFRYRREYDRACACAPVAAGEAAVSAPMLELPDAPVSFDSSASILAIAAPAAAVPLPSARRDRAIDPETSANRAGGFWPNEQGLSRTTERMTATGPDGRIVRVVGPAGPFASQ